MERLTASLSSQGMHPIDQSTLLRGPGKPLTFRSPAEEGVKNKGDLAREVMGTSGTEQAAFE